MAPKRFRNRILRFLGGTLLAVSAGCATAPSPGDANLDAVLWVQTAAEYGAVTKSIYANALLDMDGLLADTTRTASLEQRGDFGGLPPAVILDVDETVLDNSPYQARLLESGESYSSDSWAAWVEERAAQPVPGALEFTRAADRLGVYVFYVTNRRSSLESATRDNLVRLGFPVRADVDVLLMREAEASKVQRRASVARTHRVVMLFGDDLNDFVDSEGLSPTERDELARRYDRYWGESWHMLPNPTYGSWERSLFGYDSSLTPAERTERKYEHLEPKG